MTKFKTALLLGTIALGLSACGAGMSSEEIESAERSSTLAPPSADVCEEVGRKIALNAQNPGLYDANDQAWLGRMRVRCGMGQSN